MYIYMNFWHKFSATFTLFLRSLHLTCKTNKSCWGGFWRRTTSGITLEAIAPVFKLHLCCKFPRLSLLQVNWIKNCIVALGKICREYRVPWLCNDSRDWVTLLSSKFRKCMCENWIELNCWLCVPETCSVFGLLVLVEVLKNVVGSDVLCAISRTVVVIKWSWFEYVLLQFLEFCVYWMPSWKYMHLDMWNMNLLIISCCVLVNCSGNISNTCTWARIEKLEFKEESNRNLQENPTLQLKIDL